jgi:ATP-dependent Clp protease ATP-binding subunit ClpA
VLACARSVALELGETTVSTEHLLRGLLVASPGTVRGTLRGNPSVDTLNHRLEAVLPQGTPRSLEEQVQFSVLLKVVLQRAEAEADALEHAAICPEHLLLALFVQQGSEAQSLLEAFGFERVLAESRLLSGGWRRFTTE